MADENDVEVKFGASIDGLEEGAGEAKAKIAELIEHIKEFGEQAKEANEKAGEHFKELGEHADEAKEHFLELAEVFGIAFSLDALKEFIEKNAELGEELERTAAKLGITGAEASGLMGVAKLTGTSFDGLQTAMERLQVGLATVDQKSSRTAEALRVLGVSAKEMASSSITQQINILSQAISRFQDGATKTAAVQALGRSFVELLPLLDKGKEGLNEFNETLDATGSKMSNEMVAAFAHTNEDLNTMRLAWQGVSEKIFAAFNPSIDVATVKVTQFLEKFKQQDIKSWVDGAIESFQEFEVKATALIQDIIDAVEALKKTLSTIYTSLPTNKELLDKIGLHPYGPMPPGSPRGGTPPSAGPFGAIEGIGDTSLSQKIKDNAFAAATAIDQLRKSAAITAENLHDRPAVGGAEGGGKAKVPQMQLGGGGKDEAFKDAQEEAAAEIKLFTDAANQREAILDGELKRRQITTAQWLAGTKDALADELQDTIATYQAELATANLTAQQRKVIMDKIAEAEAASAVKVTKAEQKAADETTKSWQTAADQIANIMNSQVDGLLRGTESIKQAFANMVASVIEDLIKLGVKLLAEAALAEVLSIATGGAVGGGGGGIGGFLAGALHFAEGTPYVPTTGFHHLDQGEMVVPAHMNPNNPANSNSLGGGSFSNPGAPGGGDAGGSGGGDTHVHLHMPSAIDSGSVRDWFHDNASHVASALSKAVRNGDHLGLKGLGAR